MSELGKITQHFLEENILQKSGYHRKEVSTGPAFGVDVAIIDLPGGLAMASASDPLTLIPSLGLEESAWLSVYLMANDMATTSVSPMYAQFVLNLPAHLSAADFKRYWDYIDHYCKDLKISITGGHTGFIEDQNSTISGGGTLFSFSAKENFLTSKMAQPGNLILATKEAAISSSALLALSFPEHVKNKLGKEIYDQACALFYQSGSVNDALYAIGDEKPGKEINAMHDVTEGGILGAIYEMAVASGNGALIYNEKIPIGLAQKGIGKLFSFDPRFSVGAGCMIIAAKEGSEQAIIKRLKDQNISCSIVGQFVGKDKGIKIIEHDVPIALPYSGKDPYWEAFYQAHQKGWK